MKRHRSVLEIEGRVKQSVRVDIANRIDCTGGPEGIEFWELVFYADGLPPIAVARFGFAGSFLGQGVDSLVASVLDPAGFKHLSFWPYPRMFLPTTQH